MARIDVTGARNDEIRLPQRRDALLIIASRAARSFAYGMLAVALSVSLVHDGIPALAIGILITVSLIGDFCGTYVIGLYADRWGRRRTLVVLALLMAVTGAIFGLTRVYPVLLVTAFFGTLGATGSETAPFLPIEQTMLSHVTEARERTALFARYNLVASFSLAVGALVAGFPTFLTRYGVPYGTGLRLVFGVYAAAALLVALLESRLSARVEEGAARVTAKTLRQRLMPPLGASRGVVLRLAGLFSVDALAGGLTVQSLMVLYFHLRFGVPLDVLGALFFGANTLSALSFLAAAPLARRIGLLNTMVFTHLPSNVLLALVPFMPVFPLAGGVLLARQALSQMDVPTRQAYTMALVAPEERTAAASVTSLSRSAGSALTPVLSGAMLSGPLLVFGLPFIFAGAIKAAYDLALWRIFRRVKLNEQV
jgi:MFS family permease